MTAGATIDDVSVAAYSVPTEMPESDGTLEWDSVTCVVVTVRGGGRNGVGYTYADPAAAALVRGVLAGVVTGADALAPGAAWRAMIARVRNLGRRGLASMAISAVDCALWDLKARVLDVALVDLLDGCHDVVPVYGSGGFTSYSREQLCDQLSGWVAAGIPRVKLKVGREPAADPARVTAARDAIGAEPQLYVDANGGYIRTQAVALAERFAEAGVSWYEEPVSSDDIAGLRYVRKRVPAGMDVAAGEYGWDLPTLNGLLAAEAVDCLQADVTRVGGFTGFLRAGALCDARSLDLSAHCAPQLSAHACCGIWHLRHLEYFHDHVRVERLLFDGVLEPEAGVLRPDRNRPGHGLSLKASDAARYET